jgi:hypothetical protein
MSQDAEALIAALEAKAWETDYDRVVSMDDVREVIAAHFAVPTAQPTAEPVTVDVSARSEG